MRSSPRPACRDRGRPTGRSAARTRSSRPRGGRTRMRWRHRWHRRVGHRPGPPPQSSRRRWGGCARSPNPRPAGHTRRPRAGCAGPVDRPRPFPGCRRPHPSRHAGSSGRSSPRATRWRAPTRPAAQAPDRRRSPGAGSRDRAPPCSGSAGTPAPRTPRPSVRSAWWSCPENPCCANRGLAASTMATRRSSACRRGLLMERLVSTYFANVNSRHSW